VALAPLTRTSGAPAAGRAAATTSSSQSTSSSAGAAPAPGIPTWGRWLLGGMAAAAVIGGAALLVKRSSMLKMAVENPHQLGVVLTNPHRPWLAGTARIAHTDALVAQEQLFGSMAGHVDDEVDAFRHAYASGLLKTRVMRDHGLSMAAADKLVTRIGRAHELDGLDNVSKLSALMDLHNNTRGLELVGTARAGVGGSAPFITEQVVRDRVLAALEGGGLEYLLEAGTPAERLVPTTGAVLRGIA
jgi:hypothetical protein